MTALGAVGGLSGCARRGPQVVTKRAFYYWRTTLQLSAIETQALADLAIDRLYLRLFDVDWSEGDQAARPLGVLTGGAGVIPAAIEVVPVVFVRNRVLRRIDAADVPFLAEEVWRAVTGAMQRLGRRAGEVQLDCDWTDSTRDRYFALLTVLGERARTAKTTLTATVRLHQIKYRERTGVPPVGRGMLMLYNMGRIDADQATNAIYDDAIAQDYLGRAGDYPLPLDVALPIWTWVVHVRGTQVEGLLQDVDSAALGGLPWLRPVSPRRFEVTASAF
ncbi:MAG TPA: hypothetical protein VHS32_11785, partial [Streptosporangiaceae bacterium]|nr:hypothetical protein [Streptosporangiaceae bacterium]